MAASWRGTDGQREHPRDSGRLDPIARRVLFVSHEASLTGAPIMLLHLLRWLREHSEIEPQVLLLRDGELAPEFAELAPVTVAQRPAGTAWRSLILRASWDDPLAWPPPPGRPGERALRLAARRRLVGEIRRDLGRAGPPELVYLNSTFSARALSVLDTPVPLITHAHEMAFTLRSLRDHHPWAVAEMVRRTGTAIAASGPVREALVDVLGVAPERVSVCHEAVRVDEAPVDPAAVRRARDELGLAEDTLVVGTVGAVNWRKGPDLFVQLALRTFARTGARELRFAWVGPQPDAGTAAQVEHDLAAAGLAGRVRFLDARPDPRPLMALFDVFVLMSREDPFPLACLEAAVLGTPVVCFDAGGMSEFIDPGERLVVPYLDVEAMATRVIELLDAPGERAALGAALAERVAERHSIDATAPVLHRHILDALPPGAPGVARRAPRDG